MMLVVRVIRNMISVCSMSNCMCSVIFEVICLFLFLVVLCVSWGERCL